MNWDIEYNPNGRFKVLDRPIQPPGMCIICRAADRPVIDFGMKVPRTGAIYFCFTCISEAARNTGLVVDRAKAEQELLEMQGMLSSQDHLIKLAQEYNERIGVASAALITGVADVFGVMDSVEDVSTPDETAGDSSDPDGTDEGPVVEESEFDFLEGSDDVPSNSSDGPSSDTGVIKF